MGGETGTNWEFVLQKGRCTKLGESLDKILQSGVRGMVDNLVGKFLLDQQAWGEGMVVTGVAKKAAIVVLILEVEMFLGKTVDKVLVDQEKLGEVVLEVGAKKRDLRQFSPFIWK